MKYLLTEEEYRRLQSRTVLEFMGHPMEYWVELNMHAEELRSDSLIVELAAMRRRAEKAERELASIERVMRQFGMVKK